MHFILAAHTEWLTLWCEESTMRPGCIAKLHHSLKGPAFCSVHLADMRRVCIFCSLEWAPRGTRAISLDAAICGRRLLNVLKTNCCSHRMERGRTLYTFVIEKCTHMNSHLPFLLDFCGFGREKALMVMRNSQEDEIAAQDWQWVKCIWRWTAPAANLRANFHTCVDVTFKMMRNLGRKRIPWRTF